MDTETRALIKNLKRRCETAAEFIRFYHKSPEELRGWAKRIESGWAPNAVCGPLMSLERGIEAAAEWLAHEGVEA